MYQFLKHRTKVCLLLLLFFLGGSLKSKAQIVVADTLSIMELAESLVGVGVQISNITSTGNIVQFAEFDGTNTNMGIDHGIILGTGNALNAADATRAANNQNFPGSADSQDIGPVFGDGDPAGDLDAIANQPSLDAAIIEFDLRPAGDTLRFNYLFASEEYAEFVCAGFNDVFAFFVSGPGITGPYSSPAGFPNGSVNIALLPDGITPVAIDNVNNGNAGGVPCGPTNPSLYQDNGDGINFAFNYNQTFHTFNGSTVRLEASIPVQRCALYHFKLAVADVGDGSLNSSVFLESGSFESKEVSLSTAFANVYEGCKEGKIEFARLDSLDQDTINIYLEYGGSAVEGVDYPDMPDSLILPPGDSIHILNIPSFSDATAEPGENILIYVVQNDCFSGRFVVDSIEIILYDEIQLNVGEDTTIYYGDSIQLNAFHEDAISYAWTPDYRINDTSVFDPLVYPCTNTQYKVVGADTLGCFGYDSMWVNLKQRTVDHTTTDAYEDCQDGSMTFTRNDALEINKELVFYLSYGGAAFTGGDVGILPDSVLLPKGQNSVTFDIVALTDGIDENAEDLKVYISELNDCFPSNNIIDSFTVQIFDLRMEASNDTLMCLGDSIQISAVGGGSYLWSPATFVDNEFASNPIIFPNTNMQFIVQSNTNDCYKPDTVNIIVHDFKTNFEDSITQCMRVSGLIGQPTEPGFSYAWTTMTGLDNSTNSQPTLTLTTAGNFEYEVVVTDTNNCVDADTVSVEILQAPDSVEIIGGNSVCPDVTGVDYFVNDTNLISYAWSVNGGTLISGQGSDSIIVNWGSADPAANVQLIPTNQLGCVGITAQLDVVINTLLITQTPQGPDTLCFADKDLVDYSITNVNGSTYTWNWDHGVLNSGQDSNAINISWNGDSTGYLFIEEQVNTSTSLCFGKSDTLFVVINPTPDSSLAILGDSSVCSDSDSILYRLNGYTGSSYNWVSTGGTIISGQTTDSILINWSIAGNYIISVQETTNEGCAGDTIDQNIQINPLPNTGFLSGETDICPPQLEGFQYALTGFAGSNYTWTITGGTVVGSDSTNIVSVTWDSISDVKQIEVLETTQFGCTDQILTIPIKWDPSRIEIDFVSDEFTDTRLVNLEWSGLTFDTAYNNAMVLYRRVWRPATDSWTEVDTVQREDSSYVDGPLDTDTNSYQYYLSSPNLCNEQITSSEHNTILLNAVASELDESITLTWNHYNDWTPDGVSEYEIWRKVDDGTYELHDVVSADSSAIFFDADDGFVHCYRVKAVRALSGDVISWSNIACVQFEHELMVFNAFSPNGDDKNETFFVDNLHLYPSNEVQILNRWGNQVYQTENYLNDWRGGDLPDGTYFYVLKVTIGGQEELFKGTVLLHR